MSPNPKNIEEMLLSAQPAELSASEEEALFLAVRARTKVQSVPSPFSYQVLSFNKTMIPILLILALTLGAGGTVAASDSARPGDFLFPLDRAVEDLRFSVASDDGKNELRIRYADERLREFNTIAEDDDLSGALTEAEADIFTNETVVKLEAGDRKVVFITSADTREEIIDAIQDRYGYAEVDIDAVLTVETEDRASRADDKGEERERSQRLENALDVLGDFVEKHRDAASTSPQVLTALALIEARLLEREAFFPEDVRVKIKDDRARYEVRGEDGERVRVEVKDGQIRSKSDDDDDDSDEDSDDDSSGRGSDDDEDEDDSDERNGILTSQGFLEVEADVFTDTTTVKVELNDRTTTFTTSADTRAEVIDEVQDRFPGLTEAQIDAVLDFEVEDRASRADDLEDNDGDDDSSGHGSDDDDDSEDDEDEDDNDDDEDSDDDSSGHGRGGDDKDDDD